MDGASEVPGNEGHLTRCLCEQRERSPYKDSGSWPGARRQGILIPVGHDWGLEQGCNSQCPVLLVFDRCLVVVGHYLHGTQWAGGVPLFFSTFSFPSHYIVNI